MPYFSIECKTAQDVKEELQKFFKNSPYKLTNKLRPVISQIGPTCGIYAFAKILLDFLLLVLKNEVYLNTEDFDFIPVLLLLMAKEMRITNDGAIFDPKGIVRLGENFGFEVINQNKIKKFKNLDSYWNSIKRHIDYDENIMATLDWGIRGPVKSEGDDSHWIVTDGNHSLKILAVSDLWESTKQLYYLPSTYKEQFISNRLSTVMLSFKLKNFKKMLEGINKFMLLLARNRDRLQEYPELQKATYYIMQKKRNREVILLLEKITRTSEGYTSAPNHLPYHYHLGGSYLKGQQYEKAIATFEALEELNPNYKNIQFYLGMAYYHSERYEDATRAFQRVGSSNPYYSEAQKKLENIYFRSERTKRFVERRKTSKV